MPLWVPLFVLCVKETLTRIFPNKSSLLNVFNALFKAPVTVDVSRVFERPIHGLVYSDLAFDSLITNLSIMVNEEWMRIVSDIYCVINIS